MQPGDIHLLCSDGLTGVLDDELVSGMLAKHVDVLEGMLQTLISIALQRAAPDNISAALIRSKLPVRKDGK